MPSPTFVDLFETVIGNFKVLELGQLESSPLSELVALNVEPSQILEVVLVRKDADVLNLILANV